MFSLPSILFGKQPPMRVRQEPFDQLFPDALTLGTLYLGRQGAGKTSALARHLIDYFDAYSDQAIFVLDWSGDLTNKILAQFAMRPLSQRDVATHRLVYDELGNPDWVLPLPEITDNMEEDVERVKNNLNGLFHNPDEQAAILAAVVINKTLPELMRVLAQVRDDYGNSWQLTEIERLLENSKELGQIMARVKDRLPVGTQTYLLDRFVNVKTDERELRTYKLTEMVGWMKTPFVRAKLGYPRQSWTPKEAIEKGQMVIANGARLINNPTARDYFFTQIWSLIKAEANRRTPANPNDKPFSVVLDETRNLFAIPAFAQEIGDIAPVYRSRKVQLYLVIQALSQLDKELARKIWLLGNMVIFGLDNKEDCEEVAYQLAQYDPRKIKQPARTNVQNPITEPETGQDRLSADWINHLDTRQCIMKRHFDEQHKDHHIRYISRTKNIPNLPLQIGLDEYKEHLLRVRGIRVRDALAVVEKRALSTAAKELPRQAK